MKRISPEAAAAIKKHVRDSATRLGACACGVARPDAPADRAASLSEWLKQGLHGELSYMERSARLRADVRLWWPETKSVICVAVPYRLTSEATQPGCGRIAGYALGPDYHGRIREILEELARSLAGFMGAPFPFRVAVDSAPLAERSLAASCGVGVIGKNGQLLVPGVGSAVFLGELAIPFPLPPDSPLHWEPCKDCSRCRDACPTGALDGDLLDANKCLSYWTTEQRGPIPRDVADLLSSRLVGCDRCQIVCPHNRARVQAPPTCRRIDEWDGVSSSLDLASLFEMGGRALGRRLRGTALDRLGPARLWRNALAAAWKTPFFADISRLAAIKNSPVLAAQLKVLDASCADRI